MLVGKRHKILKLLTPLCEAQSKAIKKAYDVVRSPDAFKAIDARDAVLNVQSEIDKLMMWIETRKQRR